MFKDGGNEPEPDVVDDALDGPTDLPTKLMSSVRKFPPFVMYGGLMTLWVIFVVMTYVLYKTFNPKVYIVFAFTAASFAVTLYYTRGDWRTSLLVAFGSFFASGLVVAYLNVRSWASLDATLVPAQGSAIDERWAPPLVARWFALQGLAHLWPRFGLSPPDAPPPPVGPFGVRPHSGADMLRLTEGDLLRIPRLITDGGERHIVMSAVRAGLELHDRRAKAEAAVNKDVQPAAGPPANGLVTTLFHG
jgi:hypothetical protein